MVGIPTFRRLAIRCSRVLTLTLGGFVQHRCLFHASALTYVTVLSLVPFLAFAFSVAKGFGAYDYLRAEVIDPFLENLTPEGTIAPAEPVAEPVAIPDAEGAPDPGSPAVGAGAGAGDGAMDQAAGAVLVGEEADFGGQLRTAIDKVLEYVEQANFSALGITGLAALLYIVIKLLSSVERTLNDISGVKRSRTIVRKVSDYLAMVIVTPLFLLAGTAATAAVMDAQATEWLRGTLGLGPVIEQVLKLVPAFVSALGFTFLYKAMPNTRLRMSSALWGGAVGGILWQLLQVGHVRFQVGMADYNKLYSGFAALPVFLIWIYFSWAVVLLGAELAFAHQRAPSYKGRIRSGQLSHAVKEVLALRLLHRVAGAFSRGDDPWTVRELAEHFDVTERWIDETILPLVRAGILQRCEAEETLLLARSPQVVHLADVLEAVRQEESLEHLCEPDPEDAAMDAALETLREALARSAVNRSLEEISGARPRLERSGEEDPLAPPQDELRPEDDAERDERSG